MRLASQRGGDREQTLKSAPAKVAGGLDEGRLISALQANRAMKKGELKLLAMITPWQEEEELTGRAPVLCGYCCQA